MPYHTPDAPPSGEYFCRVFRVPKSPAFLSLVDGAISELCKDYRFEQVGDLTPEETAQLFTVMFLEAMEAGNVCMSNVQVDIFYDAKANNVAGGGITANVNTDIFFTTPSPENAGNVSVASQYFTVQPGLYIIEMNHVIRAAAAFIATSFLHLQPSFTPVAFGVVGSMPANAEYMLALRHVERVSAETVYAIACRSNVSRATDALGVPGNITGFPEVYGSVSFTRLGDA